MSRIGPGTRVGRRSRGEPAPAGLHRFLIASPESTAWSGPFDAGADVLRLNPFQVPEAHALGPLQIPHSAQPDGDMPRWAVYDCAEVPGAVVGLLRAPLASPHDRLLDAIAIALATPHAEPGAWHLFGLTIRTDDGADALRLETIRIAMELIAAERVTLVVPWSASWLPGLPALGPVEILAAVTSLHGAAPAGTFELHGLHDPLLTPARPTASIAIPSAPGPMLDALRRLQSEIERTKRFALRNAPRGATSARLVAREVLP